MAVLAVLTKSKDHEQLVWKDLPNFTLEFGWQLSVSNIDYFEWTKIQSQDVCDAGSPPRDLLYMFENYADQNGLTILNKNMRCY